MLGRKLELRNSKQNAKEASKAGNTAYHAKLIASVARDVGSMAACPPAAAAASIVLRILETVQEVKTNQEACERLAKRCARILTDVNEQMRDRWSSAPKPLIKNLEKFCQTLSAIHHYMELQQGRTWIKRFLTKGSVEETIQDFDVLLSQASQSFQMSTLIDIHFTVGSSSTKVASDDDQTLCSGSYVADCGRDVPRVDSPIDETKLAFFQEQPEYGFLAYKKPASNKVAQDNAHKHFRLLPLTDVQNIRAIPVPGDQEWWSDMSGVEIEGRAMVMKQYGSYEAKRGRKRWTEDVESLATIFHPNFPQMLCSAFKDAPDPFILLEFVLPISPQQAFLDYLPLEVQKQAHAWAELALHFFHQLQDVAKYLEETFELLPDRILDFLDDASPVVQDRNHLMLGLPCSRPAGQISSHRNFGILGGLRVNCIYMLPSMPQAADKLDEKQYYQLTSHTRNTLWSHFSPDHDMDNLEDESCDCDENQLRLLIENERPWVHYKPAQVSSPLSVGDLGHIPGNDQGVESFEKVRNLLKGEDGLGAERIEQSSFGEMFGRSGAIEPVVTGLHESTCQCWKIRVKPFQRIKGRVTTITRLAGERGLRYFIDSGSNLAEEAGVQPSELRLVTSIEKHLYFDITWLKEQPPSEDPPVTTYLHLPSADAPFLSLCQDDMRGLGAGDGFNATLKECHGVVHLAGLNGLTGI